jgi:hypothetical protein
MFSKLPNMATEKCCFRFPLSRSEFLLILNWELDIWTKISIRCKKPFEIISEDSITWWRRIRVHGGGEFDYMRAENPITCERRIPLHAGGEFHYMLAENSITCGRRIPLHAGGEFHYTLAENFITWRRRIRLHAGGEFYYMEAENLITCGRRIPLHAGGGGEFHNMLGWNSIFIYALLIQIICLRNAYLYSITPCLSVAYDLPKQQLAPILHSINFVLLSRRVKIFHLISSIIFCASSSILNLMSNKVKIPI